MSQKPKSGAPESSGVESEILKQLALLMMKTDQTVSKLAAMEEELLRQKTRNAVLEEMVGRTLSEPRQQRPKDQTTRQGEDEVKETDIASVSREYPASQHVDLVTSSR